MTVPGNLSSPLLATAAAAAAGADAANITKSVRFRGSSGTYLDRTPSSAGNRRAWTWSGWVKRTKFGSTQCLFYGGTSNSNLTRIIHGPDSLELQHFDNGSFTGRLETNANFLDPAAWYHFVVAVDTTQGTASDRIKLYVNGVLQDSFLAANYPSQNLDLHINNTNKHSIAVEDAPGGAKSYYFDGYIADVYHIDGQQLDCTSFGAFDSNGVWQATIYSGSYGTNGFHLFDFANEATLGHDSSGSNNDFTATNFNATTVTDTNPVVYGNFASGSLAGAFDGSTASGDRIGIRPNGSGVSFTAQTVSSKLRVYCGVESGQGTLYINKTINTGEAPSRSSPSYVDVTSDLGSLPFTLTDVGFHGGGNGAGADIYAIEVDDTVLVNENFFTDILNDVPINGDAADDAGAGGELSSNYATLNRLQVGSQLNLKGGNLDLEGTSSWRSAYSTIFLSSGKWYFEVNITDITTHSYGILVGLAGLGTNIINSEISSGDSYAVQNGPGNMKINHNGGSTDLGSQSAYAIGDVLQMAYDADNGKMWFGVNGTYINSGNPSAGSNPTQSSISGTYCFAVALLTTSDKIAVNFGQRAWAYTAPTNFKAVCTSNLPTPTIPDGSAHFEAKAYTGNAGTQTISGFEFTPDLAWLKHRAASQHHGLFDTQRGALMRLVSDYEYASTSRANTLTAFTSDGFSLGSAAEYNASAAHIAWVWNAGANSNKTYTVKVVSDSGNKYRFDDFGTSAVTLDLEEGSTYIFDQSDSSNAGHPIRFGTSANGTDYTTGVTHTGTPGSAGAKTTLVLGTGVATLYYSCANHSGMGGQINTNSTTGSSNFDGGIQATVKANQTAGFSMGTWTGTGSINTVGTGLSGTKVVILKNRDNTSNWVFYHTLADGSYDYMYLNEVNANASSSLAPFTMNNTFKVSSNTDTNASGDDYQFYAFSPVAGYSAMGKYTGDGDTSGNGPFVFTDFRPAFILIKANNSGGDAHWGIFDTQRVGYNASGGNPILYPNRATDEYGGSEYQIDILSNGFKIKVSYASGINFSSTDHYYIAFAENPFSANGGLAR